MQNKQSHAQKAHRPVLSSPSEVIKMLNMTKPHENKEQGKTQHEMPRSTLRKHPRAKIGTLCFRILLKTLLSISQGDIPFLNI